MLTDMYKQFEAASSWARYLYWADLAKRRLDALEDDPKSGEWPNWWLRFALISHAYASEYVVIEGWRDLRIEDPTIDSLLQDHEEKVTLLRRYRNGVFHYQKSLVDRRLTSFFEESERTIPWLAHLHAEFLRVYWTMVEDFPGAPEQKETFRDAMLHLVGWIPSDTFQALRRDAEDTFSAAHAMTEGDESAEAHELRAAAADFLKQARNSESGYGEALAQLYAAPPRLK